MTDSSGSDWQQPQLSPALHSESVLTHKKKLGKKKNTDDTALSEAVKTLQDLRTNITNNEFSLFGQHMGVQLGKLRLETALGLQRKIQDMVVEARLREIGVDNPHEPTTAPDISTESVLEIGQDKCDHTYFTNY